jgi:hypothetical protein
VTPRCAVCPVLVNYGFCSCIVCLQVHETHQRQTMSCDHLEFFHKEMMTVRFSFKRKKSRTVQITFIIFIFLLCCYLTRSTFLLSVKRINLWYLSNNSGVLHPLPRNLIPAVPSHGTISHAHKVVHSMLQPADDNGFCI